MAERLETWAPMQARRFEQLPSFVQEVLQSAALDAEVHAKNLAPRKTGALQRSIKGEVTGPRGLSISLTATVPYAQRVEEGGTIHGRPWLTIPLKEAITQRARQDGTLFPLRLRDGRLFLVSDTGGRLSFRWRLVRQVTIPARPFMRPALERVQRTLPGDLAQAFQRLTGASGGGR